MPAKLKKLTGEFQLKENKLCIHMGKEEENEQVYGRVVVPNERTVREWILFEMHRLPCIEHPGISQTKAMVS